jgi:hypothetical protein
MSETPDAPQFQEPVEATPTPADMPEHRDEPTTAADREKDLEHVQNLRKENKSLREKLKAAEPLLKKAQEAEESTKTEVQKAIERAEKAERAMTERDTDFARMELAVKHNIPPDDIDLIGSGTREEMEARAKRVAAKNAAAMKATPPPTDRPMEGLRPGAAPEPAKPPDDSYPAQWTPKYLRDKEGPSFYGQ